MKKQAVFIKEQRTTSLAVLQGVEQLYNAWQMFLNMALGRKMKYSFWDHCFSSVQLHSLCWSPDLNTKQSSSIYSPFVVHESLPMLHTTVQWVKTRDYCHPTSFREWDWGPKGQTTCNRQYNKLDNSNNWFNLFWPKVHFSHGTK